MKYLNFKKGKMEENKEDIYKLYHATMLDMPENTPIEKKKNMQYQALRQFLAGLFYGRAFDPQIDIDRRLFKEILEDDYMPLWQCVFTHASFDPVNNYELWEYLGDKVLKHTFATYVIDKFPEIKSPKILTLMDNYYMGYEFQSTLSVELGIPNMIISKQQIKRKDYEDVFEAIFGMLDHIVNKVYKNQGYSYTYKFLTSILSKKDISIIEERDPRSRFKAMLDLITKTTNFVRPVIEKRYSDLPNGKQIVTITLIQTIADHPHIIYQKSGDEENQSRILAEVSLKGIEFLETKGYSSDHLIKLERSLDERNQEIKNELMIYDKIIKQLNTNLVLEKRMITNYFFENKKAAGQPQVGFNLVIRDTNGNENNQEMKIGTGRTEIEAKLDAIRQFNKDYPVH